MTHRSDLQLLVLLEIRLRSLVSASTIASSLCVATAPVEAELDADERRGLVRHRDGERFAGWNLTAEGRKEGERLLADEIDGLGLRSLVEERYADFLTENPRVLAICSSWQLDAAGSSAGSREDVTPERAPLGDDLAALTDRARHVWSDLAGVLERFSSYDRRFEQALAHVRDGDGDWVTSPAIDSYHTVWFELHEHLLATLGLERASGTRVGGGAS